MKKIIIALLVIILIAFCLTACVRGGELKIHSEYRSEIILKYKAPFDCSAPFLTFSKNEQAYTQWIYTSIQLNGVPVDRAPNIIVKGTIIYFIINKASADRPDFALLRITEYGAGSVEIKCSL